MGPNGSSVSRSAAVTRAAAAALSRGTRNRVATDAKKGPMGRYGTRKPSGRPVTPAKSLALLCWQRFTEPCRAGHIGLYLGAHRDASVHVRPTTATHWLYVPISTEM